MLPLDDLAAQLQVGRGVGEDRGRRLRRGRRRRCVGKCFIRVPLSRLPAADGRDFGHVALGRDHRVVAFVEKGAAGPRLINGGVYAISHAALSGVTPGHPASLERDLLPGLVARTRRVYSYHARPPVFDIGTPDRLAHFSRELSRGRLVRP